jgi:hypothetical protein
MVRSANQEGVRRQKEQHESQPGPLVDLPIEVAPIYQLTFSGYQSRLLLFNYADAC